MPIYLKDSVISGNGGDGIANLGNDHIELDNVIVSHNGGRGLHSETKTETKPDADTKHWYQRPIGIIILGLVTAGIAALCGWAVQHFGLWPF